MANAPEDWGIEKYIDVEGRNYYNTVFKARGSDALKMGDVMQPLRLKARNNGRLLMQWDATANGGFTTSSPWMSAKEDGKQWNVEAQKDGPESVLAYWKHMLELRKQNHDVFTHGSFTMIPSSVSGEFVMAYVMTSNEANGKAFVLLNFSKKESVFESGPYQGWKLFAGANKLKTIQKDGVVLSPYEGTIYCNWTF